MMLQKSSYVKRHGGVLCSGVSAGKLFALSLVMVVGVQFYLGPNTLPWGRATCNCMEVRCVPLGLCVVSMCVFICVYVCVCACVYLVASEVWI